MSPKLIPVKLDIRHVQLALLLEQISNGTQITPPAIVMVYLD